jgi:hypothetical protein
MYTQLLQDLILLALLLAPEPAHHLLVLPHLLPQLGDFVDPLVVDLGHRQVVERLTEGNEIVNVVVVVALHDHVHDGVEHCALLHRRLRARRLDVVLDLLRHCWHPVHVQDFLPDFLLVFPNVAVRVDLLGPEVFHDLAPCRRCRA